MNYRTSVAIAFLSLSYILFTLQQYFSVIAMISILLLVLISFIMFLYKKHALLFSILGVAIVVYEVIYTITPLQYFSFVFEVLALTAFAALVSVFCIYLLRKFNTIGMDNQFINILALIFISLLAYLSMYALHNVSWNGVDEIAYNYYAAQLFASGKNPYLFSMQPILNQYKITPTLLSRGTYEYNYDYPALSFIPFFFIPLLGINSFMFFIYLIILFAIVSSYLIYTHSTNGVLVPIFVWLIATYALVGIITPYLVALLFVIAYLYRRHIVIYGIALGLAASTTQLSWFAIPFFFVLAYKEFGWNKVLKAIDYFVLVVIAVNGYFLISSPNAFLNILSILSTHMLIFYGTNIMQAFAAFYLEPYYYLSIISAIILVYALALLYIYPRSFKSFVALIPMFIFFISWRNISVYGLTYVPLLLSILYEKEKGSESLRDMQKSKKPIAYSLIALAVFCTVLGVYMHNSYVGNPAMKINSITPIVGVSGSGNQTYFSLSGFYANVTNPSDSVENATFYIVSRGPNQEAYTLGSQLPRLAPHSSYNYTINYVLPMINNKTELIVFVISSNYFVSNTITLSKLK